MLKKGSSNRSPTLRCCQLIPAIMVPSRERCGQHQTVGRVEKVNLVIWGARVRNWHTVEVKRAFHEVSHARTACF